MGDLLAIEVRTRPFGWSPIVQFDGRDIAQYLPILEQISGDYVIDHAGKFLEPVDVEAPSFNALLTLIDRVTCFVNISSCSPHSKLGPPSFPAVRALPTLYRATCRETVCPSVSIS